MGGKVRDDVGIVPYKMRNKSENVQTKTGGRRDPPLRDSGQREGVAKQCGRTQFAPTKVVKSDWFRFFVGAGFHPRPQVGIGIFNVSVYKNKTGIIARFAVYFSSSILPFSFSNSLIQFLISMLI